VAPTPSAVAANADELAALAALLRAEVPVYARGLAMLRNLLTDGAGPAYTDPLGPAFGCALEEAHAALR
jgi:hypothetical protein